MELTIDNIIKLLSTDGVGSKQIVLQRLKDASYMELHSLRRSITERINEMAIKNEEVE